MQRFGFLAGLLMILAGLQSGPALAQQACPALGPKAVIGAATGGALGAGIGAAATRGSTKGTLLGGLAGTVVGGAVGSALDQRDCQQAQLALRQMAAAQTGQQVAWNDPATGNHGYFLPTGDTKPGNNGQPCRTYNAQSTMANGQANDAYGGVVCRTPDGDWVTQ